MSTTESSYDGSLISELDVKRYCRAVNPQKQKGLVQHIVGTDYLAKNVNTIYANQLVEIILLSVENRYLIN
ncbi:hypothetical protein [Marinimicrobium sp. C2-29]|uniref:hypothetical protein n=1 Tax=Marinimicrobium sp. C2-29 TaxID=3139825 RepID=UPI003139545C